MCSSEGRISPQACLFWCPQCCCFLFVCFNQDHLQKSRCLSMKIQVLHLLLKARSIEHLPYILTQFWLKGVCPGHPPISVTMLTGQASQGPLSLQPQLNFTMKILPHLNSESSHHDACRGPRWTTNCPGMCSLGEPTFTWRLAGQPWGIRHRPAHALSHSCYNL